MFREGFFMLVSFTVGIALANAYLSHQFSQRVTAKMAPTVTKASQFVSKTSFLNASMEPPTSTHQSQRQAHHVSKNGCPERRDDSYAGLLPGLDGVVHANWTDKICDGTRSLSSCIKSDTVDYLKSYVRMGIVTGQKGTFRVELSYCTWLSHFPPSIVSVFTDALPTSPRTPHNWQAIGLPPEVSEKGCDLYSPYIRKGYRRVIQSSGQGYSVPWIKAQFRYLLGLKYLVDEFLTNSSLRWVLLIDDDTIIQPDRLVERLRQLDHKAAWYLSDGGWGGAGHIFTRGAALRLAANLSQCLDRWMIRQFRASDTVLVKCAAHLKLYHQKESSLSHCPASNLRDRLLHPKLISMHAKKDFYPPLELATWKIALYYLAAFCNSPFAKDAAVEWSSCAFGSSCKMLGCTREKDRQRTLKWSHLMRNTTIEAALVPFYDDALRRTASHNE